MHINELMDLQFKRKQITSDKYAVMVVPTITQEFPTVIYRIEIKVMPCHHRLHFVWNET